MMNGRTMADWCPKAARLPLFVADYEKSAKCKADLSRMQMLKPGRRSESGNGVNACAQVFACAARFRKQAQCMRPRRWLMQRGLRKTICLVWRPLAHNMRPSLM